VVFIIPSEGRAARPESRDLRFFRLRDHTSEPQVLRLRTGPPMADACYAQDDNDKGAARHRLLATDYCLLTTGYWQLHYAKET